MDIATLIPGGIALSDHLHIETNDGTCSRCRQPIPEADVPILLWLRGGPRIILGSSPRTGAGYDMYAFCERCCGVLAADRAARRWHKESYE